MRERGLVVDRDSLNLESYGSCGSLEVPMIDRGRHSPRANPSTTWIPTATQIDLEGNSTLHTGEQEDASSLRAVCGGAW
jgi:hypothetical protein